MHLFVHDLRRENALAPLVTRNVVSNLVLDLHPIKIATDRLRRKAKLDLQFASPIVVRPFVQVSNNQLQIDCKSLPQKTIIEVAKVF